MKRPILETKILGVGDRIRPGLYRLHSRFNQVVNLAYGTGLASVVRKEIGAGPLNIVVDNLGLAQIDRIKIASQSIVLGQQRFGFKDEHLYNSTIELEELNWGDFEKA